MRDYQPQLNNPYVLPKTLYRRVLAVIRDYDRQKEEMRSILFDTPNNDGIRSGKIGKPSEDAALRIAQHAGDVELVDAALISSVPTEYRKGVFDNVRYGTKFPEIAHYKTWLRYRQRFIFETAKKLNIL